MSIQQKQFTKFIKLLSDNDCLQHVILVGSWAEFIYEQSGMLKDFAPNIKTMDIDFLLINMRKPNPPTNVTALAKEAGYLVENDVLDGTTKILDKEGLEIEFLINKVGAGLESSLRTNLGVVAQSLRHMDILLRNSTSVNYLGMSLIVPFPEAYVIHKMVINNQRKNKQEKDRNAIINLFPYLDTKRFQSIKDGLTKKEQKAVDVFIESNFSG
ncbi:MAG: GSU2403 family nucleotidyltransferase fold protein [Lachnospiraceae bacterium]|nr:GSU2403 family nucleotidyltransferase fold protein [Lachnospiraceae bacterium]